MTDNLTRLPKEPVDRITKPFLRFLRIEATAGLILLLCTVLALLASNTGWSREYLSLWEIEAGFRLANHEFTRSLQHWINEGLMTLFFFVVALELKREVVLGELRNARQAALPFAAALGGMAAPASVFLLIASGDPGAAGWGTVMSTDTAFVIGCLAILKSRVPESLRLFLLSLAIFDDIGAISVLAVGYGGPLNWLAIAATVIGLSVVATVSRLGVRSLPVYFALGGGVWLALDASGIQPTLAGVILGLMTPARSWISSNRLHAIFNLVVARPAGTPRSGDTVERRDLQRAGIAAREALSPIERLEIFLHPWVAFTIMPLFALANAGVGLSPSSLDVKILTAIFVAFLIGKPLGILTFSYIAVRSGLAVLPAELSWRLLAAGSLLTGIGFTMAIFIGQAAFDPALLDSVKLGILAASTVSATAGLVALVWLTHPGCRQWFRMGR
jgi:NhaA family Na+:H+ antiporter